MIIRASSLGRPAGGARRGTVYLVGAGPGDPGLLTRRAARLIRRADVVVHDALIGERILATVPAATRTIDVGKRSGGRHTAQEAINRLLVELAREANTVVRLKGGDPFVFGRGGEEAVALADAGIRFRVVPGVTAAVGVSAYAGIPLTHRDHASSVTFVTGHETVCPSGVGVDWNALARLSGTIAVYMGVAGLESIADRLVAGGRDPETPAAVVEWGTYARQRTVTAPLRDIAAAVASAGIGAPALVVIGEVVDLRDRLAWFDRLPLRGRRIVVARSRPQPSVLVRAFERLGADVTEYPRLRRVPVDDAPGAADALARIGAFDWIAFSSPAGVAGFWRLLKGAEMDARALAGLRIASFGVATTAALSRRGLWADLQFRTFSAAAAFAEMERFRPTAGSRVLFPREDSSVSELAFGLRRAGADVQELMVFSTRADTTGGEELLRTADAIVLPSSSAARAVAAGIAGIEAAAPRGVVVAIGPSTARTAVNVGLPVHAVADGATFEELTRTVVRVLRDGATAVEGRTGTLVGIG